MPVEIGLRTMVALTGLDHGEILYGGWMLQVLVTVQSCLCHYSNTSERLQKTPPIRVINEEKVGKTPRQNKIRADGKPQTTHPSARSMPAVNASVPGHQPHLYPPSTLPCPAISLIYTRPQSIRSCPLPVYARRSPSVPGSPPNHRRVFEEQYPVVERA